MLKIPDFSLAPRLCNVVNRLVWTCFCVICIRSRSPYTCIAIGNSTGHLRHFDIVLCAAHYAGSPPAKSQNPSPPLHPTTDKLGFSGCLEQSVVTPNPVVGQREACTTSRTTAFFGKWENACVSMATGSHERVVYKISFTLSARSSTSLIRFVA